MTRPRADVVRLRPPDEGAPTVQAGDLLPGDEVLVDADGSALTGMVCCAKRHGDDSHVHLVNLPEWVDYELWSEVPHTHLLEKA